MKTIKSVILAICILIFLTECTGSILSNKSKETIPGIDIPLDEYNSVINIIKFPYIENSNKNGDYMVYEVINHSNQDYVFPYDYGIRIFEGKGGSWEPIENQFGYGATDTKFLLVPQAKFATGLLIRLTPFIPVLKEKTTIRVVVVGHLEDDPSQLVGAYIDVPLKP